MERNIKIERYKPGREKEVLKLLQGSGRRFQLADIPVAAGEIKQEDFEKFVLGHKDFKPEDVFLAISKDELLGIMCIRKEENKGLVPVLVIKNHYLERVGPFLLRKAEESLLQVDRVIIGVGVGLIPLISWIREKEERNLVQFLLSQGYRKSHDIRLHMALEVKNFKTPDNLEKLEEQCNRKGIHFRPCLNENELENVFQKFDLRRGYVEELRIQKRLDLIHLAFLKNRIIGYCSYLGRSLGRNELVFGPDISFQMLSFTVTLLEGSLLPNDIIEIKLIGGRAQTFTDNFRFVFFVDHDGDGVFGRLPGFSYVKVLPEKAEHLRLLVPSLVKRGEEYPLRVQVMDKYNNYIREYQDFLKITSTDVEEVSRRGQRRMLKSQLRGLHRVKAVGTKGAISGISPPFFVSDRTFKYHIFWGSIHNHSCLGDGYGNLDFIYHYARDVSGLDFCSVSEHAGFLTINKWAEMQRVAEKYNQPGEFVTFLGCEWNPPDIGVELNYYYPDDKGPLLPSPLLRYLSYRNMDYVPDVERTLKDKNVENAWAELKKRGGIVVLHCSGRRKAKEVNLNILKKYRNCVTLMEIYSEWGASEYFNNPRSPSKEFAAERDDCLHFQRALALGLRTGVIGDGDDHVGMPGSLNTLPHRISPNIWKNALMHPAGLAAVYARELSREGIFDALRNRRCYGTSGSRIFLDFRLGNHLMGEEINIEKEKELWSKRELWVKVGGTAPIEKISIIRNGKEIYYLKGMGDTAEFKYIDRDKASEVVKLSPLYESSLIYYYLRVVQVDGEMAWSSPIWLSWKEGCGAIK